MNRHGIPCSVARPLIAAAVMLRIAPLDNALLTLHLDRCAVCYEAFDQCLAPPPPRERLN